MTKKKAPPAKKVKNKDVALEPRQERFVFEYLKDFNGTQAAIRAGYSRKTANEQAARLLAKDSIKKAVHEGRKRLKKRTEISAARVLEELARLAFVDAANFVEHEGTGKKRRLKLRDVKELHENESRCISKLRFNQNGELEIELHSKDRALDKLMKHLGMDKSILTPPEVPEGEKPGTPVVDPLIAALDESAVNDWADELDDAVDDDGEDSPLQ